MRSKRTPLATALLALALVGAGAPAQDPPAGDQGDKPRGTIRMRTDMERLFEAYGVTQGGRSKLRALKGFSFRWVPHLVTEEGVRELEPIDVTIQMAGADRWVRLEEDVEGHHRTKIVNDLLNSPRVWVDGEERRIPELLRTAQEEARWIFLLFDLLYRPESPDLASRYDKQDVERDGKKYVVAQYEFHPARNLGELTYRLFYENETGLIDRIDVHDKNTPQNLRVSTFYLGEYGPVGKGEVRELIKVPRRVELKDRAGQTLALWRFVDVVQDPERPPGFFRGL